MNSLNSGCPRGSRPLVVIEAGKALSHQARYEDQIFCAAAADVVDVRFRGVIGPEDLAEADVIHVSGSDAAFCGVRSGMSPTERVAAVESLVHGLDRRGVALVRTWLEAENSPVDGTDRRIRDLLGASTTTYITFDQATRTPDPGNVVVIPYAEQAERFAGYPVRDRIHGRIAALATSTGFEGASGLLKTAFLARTEGLSFRVCGLGNGMETLLDRALWRSSRSLTARLEPLSDAAVIEEITAAEMVVTDGTNSLDAYQKTMMALAFGRPVIVPASLLAMALVRDFGEGRVYAYEGPLTARTLDTAVSQIRASTGPGPALTSRGWQATGERYLSVFQEAAARSRDLALTA